MRCSRLALTLFSWPEYVLTTYQRNMEDGSCLLSEEDVDDEALERLVGRVQVHADDEARDDHDRRAGDELALPRPLDLLQLHPRLLDVRAQPAEEAAPPDDGGRPDGLGLRRRLGLAGPGPRPGELLSRALP